MNDSLKHIQRHANALSSRVPRSQVNTPRKSAPNQAQEKQNKRKGKRRRKRNLTNGRRSSNGSAPSSKNRTKQRAVKGSRLVTTSAPKTSMRNFRSNLHSPEPYRHTFEYDSDKMVEKEPMERSYRTKIEDIEHSVTAMAGSEYLTTISITDDDTNPLQTIQGTPLYAIPLNPNFLEGTRLARLATLFQQYRWKGLVVELVPMMSANASGSIVSYMTYDASANPTMLSGDQLIRTAMAHQGASLCQVFRYSRIYMDEEHLKQPFYTAVTDEARFEMPGVLYIIAASDISAGLSTTTVNYPAYNVIIHYEIEMWERGLDNVNESPLSETFALDISTASDGPSVIVPSSAFTTPPPDDVNFGIINYTTCSSTSDNFEVFDDMGSFDLQYTTLYVFRGNTAATFDSWWHSRSVPNALDQERISWSVQNAEVKRLNGKVWWYTTTTNNN